MAVRNTLFAKILGWFFLNLLLIGTAIWAAHKYQIGPGSPFWADGPAKERVRQVSQVISTALTNQLREDWPSVLQQYSEIYKVEFHLVGADGQPLLNNELKLPEDVREEIRRLPRPLPPRRQSGPSLAEQLKLSPEQAEKFQAARRARDLGYRSIWTQASEGNPTREERVAKARELFTKAQEDYGAQLDDILNEEQRKQYDTIAQRNTRNFLQGRRLIPRPEQAADLIASADGNNDGQLNAAELERWLRQRLGQRPRPPGARDGNRTPPANAANAKAPKAPDKGSPTERLREVFTETTYQPKAQYWAGTEIPVTAHPANTAEPPREDLRGLRRVQRGQDQVVYLATLVAVSDTMGGAGLFADPLPWVPIALGAMVLSALFWLPMVRNITRPIAEVTMATEQIAEGKFDTRVSTNRTDEIGRVGHAVDFMADRLDGFVKGQRRFLGDISHELCSPIARVQAALGILGQRADDEQKKYVQDVQDEVEHMSELVNELLLFSQENVTPRNIELEPVALRELVDTVVARECGESGSPRVEIAKDIRVQANPRRLTLAIGNLLRNAMQYASKEGPIIINAKSTDKGVEVRVTDCGPGLPEDCLPQIFDPFYRPEPSRGRDTGGVGLGLAIVKTCIEACNGTVTCRNRKPTGLEFKIVLDNVAEAAA